MFHLSYDEIDLDENPFYLDQQQFFLKIFIETNAVKKFDY